MGLRAAEDTDAEEGAVELLFWADAVDDGYQTGARPSSSSSSTQKSRARSALAIASLAGLLIFAAYTHFSGAAMEVDAAIEDAKTLQLLDTTSGTCPGKLLIKGLGHLDVINHKGVGTNDKIAVNGGTLVAHMGGRAYLGDQCASTYDHNYYTRTPLLGNTLRYTIDLRGAGCGCNAAFYLVSMKQNTEVSKCGDYYCDANAVCGVRCTELDIMEANMYAWRSTLHTANDGGGMGMGYGGSGALQSSWQEGQYGPGGTCINTRKPFDVEVGFVVDSNNAFRGVKVTLSQAGSPCPLSSMINWYQANGQDGMPEMSKALAEGMTPVVSYWSSDYMGWLDKSGPSGAACQEDHASQCPESMSVYNFTWERSADNAAPSTSMPPTTTHQWTQAPTPAPWATAAPTTTHAPWATAAPTTTSVWWQTTSIVVATSATTGLQPTPDSKYSKAKALNDAFAPQGSKNLGIDMGWNIQTPAPVLTTTMPTTTHIPTTTTRAPPKRDAAGFWVYEGQDTFAFSNVHRMSSFNVSACEAYAFSNALDAFVVWRGECFFRAQSGRECQDALKDSWESTAYILDSSLHSTTPPPVQSTAATNQAKSSTESTPKVQAQYIKLAYGDGSCPSGTQILTVQGCKEALQTLNINNLGLMWKGDDSSIPKGCSVKGDVQGHWNSASSGSGRSDLAPICHAQASEHTPPSYTVNISNRFCKHQSEAAEKTMDPSVHFQSLQSCRSACNKDPECTGCNWECGAGFEFFLLIKGGACIQAQSSCGSWIDYKVVDPEWAVYPHMDTHSFDNVHRMSADFLGACKKYALLNDLDAFAVWHGECFFRSQSGLECADSLKDSDEVTTYISWDSLRHSHPRGIVVVVPPNKTRKTLDSNSSSDPPTAVKKKKKVHAASSSSNSTDENNTTPEAASSSSNSTDEKKHTPQASSDGTAEEEDDCAFVGADCRKQRCCHDAGFRCYVKNQFWAGCNQTCEPNRTGEAPWNCTVLSLADGEPTPAPTPAHLGLVNSSNSSLQSNDSSSPLSSHHRFSGAAAIWAQTKGNDTSR